MKRTIIIAEAGVNHNGDIEIAKQLIDAASAAKADYIKFQTFNAHKLVSNKAKKAEYQIINTSDNYESQLSMLQKLELSAADHYTLINYCKQKDIAFFSTAFDLDSLDFLGTLELKLFKIPSGEITNLPYLRKIAGMADELLLSTGMCTMQEIADAIKVIKQISDVKITVLHCNTEYPTPMKDVNLLAMNAIKDEFNVEIGYSDHTLGIEVPIAAVALGAKVIEKHFTLNRNLTGPDHAASIEPDELKQMIQAIRNIEEALGSSVKAPSPSELKNILIARKSIHLINSKLKGEAIVSEDLEMLRPGDGISPMKLDEVIGKTIKRDLLAGHKLIFEDIEQ